MLYSKLVVSFCSHDTAVQEIDRRHDVVHVASFAVHARSTVDAVLASIQQRCSRIQQVAHRLPSLTTLASGEYTVFDKGDFSEQHTKGNTYLFGDGSEPAYPIKDVIRMAMSVSTDELTPENSARSTHTQPGVQELIARSSLQSCPSQQQAHGCSSAQATLPAEHPSAPVCAVDPHPAQFPSEDHAIVPITNSACAQLQVRAASPSEGQLNSERPPQTLGANHVAMCTHETHPPAVADPVNGSVDEDDVIVVAQEYVQALGEPSPNGSAATHQDTSTAAEDVKPAIQPPAGSHGNGTEVPAAHASVNGFLAAAKVDQSAAAPAADPVRGGNAAHTTSAVPHAVKRVSIADLAAMLAFGVPAGEACCGASTSGHERRLRTSRKSPVRRGTHPMMSRKRALSSLPSSTDKDRNPDDGDPSKEINKETSGAEEPSQTPNEYKLCNACGKAKPISHFHKSQRGNSEEQRMVAYCLVCEPIMKKCRSNGVLARDASASIQDGSIDSVLAEIDEKRKRRKHQVTVAVPRPVGCEFKQCNACGESKDTEHFKRAAGPRLAAYCNDCIRIVDRCRRHGVAAAQVRAAMQCGSLETLLTQIDKKSAGNITQNQEASQSIAPALSLPLQPSKQCTICAKDRLLDKLNSRQRRFFADTPIVEDLYCKTCSDILMKIYSINPIFCVDKLRQAFKDDTVTELVESELYPVSPSTPRRSTTISASFATSHREEASEEGDRAGPAEHAPGGSAAYVKSELVAAGQPVCGDIGGCG